MAAPRPPALLLAPALALAPVPEGPGLEAWSTWCDAAQRGRDWATLERLARACLREHPEAGLGWAHLGRALKELGRFEEADRALDEAVLRDPEAPEPWLQLALLRSHRGASPAFLGLCREELLRLSPETAVRLLQDPAVTEGLAAGQGPWADRGRATREEVPPLRVPAQPVFPPKARLEAFTAQVWVPVVVDAAGRVIGLGSPSGHPDLVAPALAYVVRLRFAPWGPGGTPRPFRLHYGIPFTRAVPKA